MHKQYALRLVDKQLSEIIFWVKSNNQNPPVNTFDGIVAELGAVDTELAQRLAKIAQRTTQEPFWRVRDWLLGLRTTIRSKCFTEAMKNNKQEELF